MAEPRQDSEDAVVADLRLRISKLTDEVNRLRPLAEQKMMIDAIVGEGYHSFEWDYNSDTETLSLLCHDELVQGRDEDECLIRMLERLFPESGKRRWPHEIAGFVQDRLDARREAR